MNAWAVRCIWCQAEPNHSCRTSDGQLRVAHRARVRMARANVTTHHLDLTESAEKRNA